jgi:DHA1 family bicyclomycin/chloramphenicol resistance-like MFS transporter
VADPPSHLTDEARAPEPAAAPAARKLGRTELTGLLALSMALAALGIDLMLPAFAAIRSDLGLPVDSTAVAGLVTAYFLGLALGQLAYGPISDRFGRKPTLYVGYAVYGVGAVMAALAPSLALLLVARFVWGLGAAGPRVVTLAVIRDTYEGDRMARAMSFVMAVFILVPVLAPTLGAGIEALSSWRWIFVTCAAAVVIMAFWARRLPETLHPEDRMELRVARIAGAARAVVSNRQTVFYTLAMTSLYGVFISYIASSEVIFSDVFDLESSFPLVFGGLAAFMGLGMLANARMVHRLGTRRVAHGVLLGYVVMAVVVAVMALATGGRPPLVAFLPCLAVVLWSHALMIPNFNTLAMMPMGAIAGTASSVIGATQIAVGALLGLVLDQAFDGTILPLSLGFLGYGLLALVLVLVAERGRLFGATVPGARVELEPIDPTVPAVEG